jgi:TRAP-type C4-dicarboxylate transport system substrate-binding protein
MMRKGVAAFVATMALAFAGAAAAAAAADKGSVSLDLNSATSLAGQALPEGRYLVSWSTEGDAATVVFKSGKLKIEAKARVEQRSEAASDTAVVSRGAGSAKTVAEVRLRGKKDVLVLSAS